MMEEPASSGGAGGSKVSGSGGSGQSDGGLGGASPDAAAIGGAGGNVAKPRLPRPADDDYKPEVISKLRFAAPTGGEIGQVQANLSSLFLSRSFTGKNGMKLNYRFHVPDRVSYKNKAPLLVFMHGAGERGYGCRWEALQRGR